MNAARSVIFHKSSNRKETNWFYSDKDKLADVPTNNPLLSKQINLFFILFKIHKTRTNI